MSDKYEKLITVMPLFHGFRAAGARRLIDCGEIREYRAGEQICAEGDKADSVILILTGKLQAFLVRDDIEMIVSDFDPGAILGDVAVLCGTPRALSLRAVQDSVALHWTSSNYRMMLLSDPLLSHRIFGQTMKMLMSHEKALLESVIERHRLKLASPPAALPAPSTAKPS